MTNETPKPNAGNESPGEPLKANDLLQATDPLGATEPEEGTAADVLKHRDPLPPQRFKTPNGVFEYDGTRLTFLQIMHAEELGMWKKEQCEVAAQVDFQHVQRSGGIDYVLDMASYLLVPVQKSKRQAYSHDKRHETKAAVALMEGPEHYNRLEACIRDFFTRRGKRSLGSITLSRTNPARLLSTLMQAQQTQTSSGASSGPRGSSIPANTNAG